MTSAESKGTFWILTITSAKEAVQLYFEPLYRLSAWFLEWRGTQVREPAWVAQKWEAEELLRQNWKLRQAGLLEFVRTLKWEQAQVLAQERVRTLEEMLAQVRESVPKQKSELEPVVESTNSLTIAWYMRLHHDWKRKSTLALEQVGKQNLVQWQEWEGEQVPVQKQSPALVRARTLEWAIKELVELVEAWFQKQEQPLEQALGHVLEQALEQARVEKLELELEQELALVQKQRLSRVLELARTLEQARVKKQKQDPELELELARVLRVAQVLEQDLAQVRVQSLTEALKQKQVWVLVLGRVRTQLRMLGQPIEVLERMYQETEQKVLRDQTQELLREIHVWSQVVVQGQSLLREISAREQVQEQVQDQVRENDAT